MELVKMSILSEITSLLCNECHSDYSCLDYNDNDI